MLSNGIKEDPVSATKEEPKKLERIVPIQMTGREGRSRSRDKAANPFLDGDDISKNKGDVTKLSNGKSAPLATAEVIIKKMFVGPIILISLLFRVTKLRRRATLVMFAPRQKWWARRAACSCNPHG